MSWNPQTILLIFVAITGLAILLQAIVLLCILLALRKTARQLLQLGEELRSTVIPVAVATHKLIEKVGPQLIGVTATLAELTRDWRAESADIRSFAHDLKERIQRQAAHLDGILSTTLDRVEKLTLLVDAAFSTPVRQANGVVQAFRAAFERYFRSEPTPAQTHASGDRDMFV